MGSCWQAGDWRIAGGLAAQVDTWTVTCDAVLVSTLFETISCST